MKNDEHEEIEVPTVNVLIFDPSEVIPGFKIEGLLDEGVEVTCCQGIEEEVGARIAGSDWIIIVGRDGDPESLEKTVSKAASARREGVFTVVFLLAENMEPRSRINGANAMIVFPTEERLRLVLEILITLAFQNELICVDFADIRAVLTGAGVSWVSMGAARGRPDGDRVEKAAQEIISTLPVEEVSHFLLVVRAGYASSIQEVVDAADCFREVVPDRTEMVHGRIIREDLGDELQLILIADAAPFRAEFS